MIEGRIQLELLRAKERLQRSEAVVAQLVAAFRNDAMQARALRYALAERDLMRRTCQALELALFGARAVGRIMNR